MSQYVHRQEVNRWGVREVVTLSGRNKSLYVCDQCAGTQAGSEHMGCEGSCYRR